MSGHYPARAMNAPTPLHHQPQAPPQGAPMPQVIRGPAPFPQPMPPRSRHSSSSYSSSQSSYPCPPSPPTNAVPRDLRPRDTAPIPVSDIRHERLTESDAREYLSKFVVVRLERARNLNEVDAEGYPLKPSWERVQQFPQTDYPQEEARRRVAQLMRDSKPVYEKMRAKDLNIQRQIERVLDDFKEKEKEVDRRYQYTLAQFESLYLRPDDHSVDSAGRRRRSHRSHHVRRSRRHSSRGRSPRKERQAIIIYLKRTPAEGESGLKMFQEENQRRMRNEMPAAPTVHLHPDAAGYPPVVHHPAPIYSTPPSHHPSPPTRSAPGPHLPSLQARSAPVPHHPPPTHAVPTAPVNTGAPPMNPGMRSQPRPAMSAKPEQFSRPPSRAQPKQPQPESDGESSGESGDEEDTVPVKQFNPAHPKTPGTMPPRTAPARPRPGVAPARPDGAAVPPPRPGPGNFPMNPNAAPAPRGPPANLPANPNAAPAPRGPPLNMPTNPNAAPAPRGPPANMPTNPNAAPAPRGPPANLPANPNAAPAPRGPPPGAPRPGPVPNPQVAVPPPNAAGRPAPPAQAQGVNPGRMANPQAQPKFDPQAVPQKLGVSAPDMRPQPNGQVRLQKPPMGAQVNAPGSPVTADDHIIVTTTISGKNRKSKSYDDSDRSSRDSIVSDGFSAGESEGTRPSSVSSDSSSRRRNRERSSTRAHKDRHGDVRDSRRTRRDSDEERSSRLVSRPRARFDSPERRAKSSHRRRESPERRGESYHRRESSRRRRESSHRRRMSPAVSHRRREESRSPRRDYYREDDEWIPRRRESVLSPRVVQRNPVARLVSAPEAQREIYADHEMSRVENRLERARREDNQREREIRRDNDRLRDLGDSFRHRRGLRSRLFDLLGDDSRESRWRDGEARDYMRRSADSDRVSIRPPRPPHDREVYRRD